MIHTRPGLYLRHEPDDSPAPLLVDVSRSKADLDRLLAVIVKDTFSCR